jgi:hypothetical protein
MSETLDTKSTFAGAYSPMVEAIKMAAEAIVKRNNYNIVGDWLAAVGGTLRTIYMRALETDPRELIRRDRADQAAQMNDLLSRLLSPIFA